MKNNEEIEVKFHVHDLNGLEMRLQQLGAHLVQPRSREVNLRFDRPDGSLERSHRVLRLRQDAQARLTYKGPGKLRDGVRVREEIEFSVGDFDATQTLLEALGFQVAVLYEKFRRAYGLGETRVMLDEMPYGDFVEIEGPRAGAIREAAQALGLPWDRRITSSYLAIFHALRRKRKLKFRDLTFANFAGNTFTPDDLGIPFADDPA